MTAQAQEYAFSKNLAEMRNIALSIFPDKSLRILYDGSKPTSFANCETNVITLSLKPYPYFVTQNGNLAQKVLDGDMGHELGHLILTKPIWEACNNWVTGIQRRRGFFNLASELVNIVEDKRVNHFMISVFIHDIGKRLLIANLVIKDMVDNNIEPKGAKQDVTIQVQAGLSQAHYIMAILVNQGLYEARCTQLWAKLSDSAKTDAKQCLRILEQVKYERVRVKVLGAMNQLYILISKYLTADYVKNNYCASRHHNGDLKGELSDKLKDALENEINAELKDAGEKLKDLNKGAGAGEGKGEEIPAPLPNLATYQALLDETRPEINALLNLLKKTLRPITRTQDFQKRGRLMASVIPKAYVQSLSRPVSNIYTCTQTTFEKEQVAIAFLFDFSGSVPRDTAVRITTVLNETFGHYVDDAGFSIGVFGDGTQKVKTFFESYSTTKARVGGISVSANATYVAPLLESNLKQFNLMRGNRRKICVIASDFSFSDADRATELVQEYAKSGIELIFIGFGSYDNMDEFAPSTRAKRTKIRDISDLPQRFMETYLNVQR